MIELHRSKLALLLLATIGLTLAPAATLAASNDRHNLFDPVFELDDPLDIHTVTAGSSNSNSRQSAASSAPKFSSALPAGTQRPAAITTFVGLRKPAREAELARETRPPFQQRHLLPVLVAGADDQQVRQQAAANVKRQLTGDQPEPSLSLRGPQKSSKQKAEGPSWSALQNYYEKLAGRGVAQQEPVYVDYPVRERDEPIPSFFVTHAASNRPLVTKPKLQPFLLPQYPTKDVNELELDAGTKGGLSSIIGSGQLRESFLVPARPVVPQSLFEPTQVPLELGAARTRSLQDAYLGEILQQRALDIRLKHQQDTLGEYYNPKVMLEDGYCEQRNNVNSQLTQDSLISLLKTIGANQNETSEQKLGYLQMLNQKAESPAGQYPSHMGIYSGPAPGDDNFLCSASWISDRFALTTASCLIEQRDNATLTVRAGEWYLNRNLTSAPVNSKQHPAQVISRVAKVHFCPKYARNSSDHNLALVEFANPINFLEHRSICPACRSQPRSTLRMGSCWTPVRNVTKEEYFDPEGEGETRERKVINMSELPVKLVANDENECRLQTKVEYFQYRHPNYICSASYKMPSWRARLNQTDYFGSGIYCNENGLLQLVSIIHPIHPNTPSASGYIDLSYYKPWMTAIMSTRALTMTTR